MTTGEIRRGIVDLRSEAVAPLNGRVRQALAEAPDGSDSYDEDRSVRELEQRLTDMFGMRSAMFVPTGRMANMLALGALAEVGSEILLDADAHLVRSEYGMAGRLWGIQTRTFASERGLVRREHLSPMLDRLENPTLRTQLVCLEDTHSVHGGTAQDLDEVRRIARHLAERQTALYCDGSRLWYANVIQGVPWTVYGDLYDGLSVSLVKGIGAPVGAALLLKENARSRLRELRRMLGGAWVRPGPLASAALRALEVNLPAVGHDCAMAQRLAETISRSCPDATVAQATNVVMIDVENAATFYEKCRAEGVLVFRYTPARIRLVTHRGITPEAVNHAASVIGEVYRSSGQDYPGGGDDQQA